MRCCAFAAAPAARVGAPRLQSASVGAGRRVLRAAPVKQCRVRMAADGGTDMPAKPRMPKFGGQKSSESARDSSSDFGFEAPTFDKTAFSDFVDMAQVKSKELQTKATEVKEALSEIDVAVLADDAKAGGLGLVDNVIAGDWLNRGELYGAVQLLFVVLLLRSPGFLDTFIGFLVGPVTLLAGAVVSGKAVYDLGRKQLSIWPAPVPGAELKVDGIYQVVRHPVYAGLVLASLGYAAATGSAERLALAIALAAFLTKKIDVEEDFLMDAYPDYEAYQKEVPFKLVPRVW